MGSWQPLPVILAETVVDLGEKVQPNLGVLEQEQTESEFRVYSTFSKYTL